MTHPSLGLPPLDSTAGRPDAAARIRAAAPHLAARALAVAMDADKRIRDHTDDDGLRGRLRDAELLAERIAICVATDATTPIREYADWTSPVYRRKRVPLDDIIGLCEGLRLALGEVLTSDDLAAAHDAIDAAVDQYRWHRRLAGDARKKNAFLQFIYKGG